MVCVETRHGFSSFLPYPPSTSPQPEIFADILCHDHELPRIFQDPIAAAIRSQVTQYTMLKEIQLPTRHTKIKIQVCGCPLHLF